MSSNRRFAIAVMLALATAVGAGSARAQSAPADVEAARAQAALSERYAQVWSTLSASERQRFLEAERAWLHTTRWREQGRCVQTQSADLAAEDAGARCLAEVTWRRLNTLSAGAVAYNPPGSSGP